MASSPAQPAVRERNQDRALFVGLAVGVGALSLFLLVGLLSAGWNLAEAVSYVSPTSIGPLLYAGSLVVAVFGIPVAAFLGWRLVVPAVLLAVVVVFWAALTLSVPVINAATVTGMVYYGLLFSPVSLVLYALGGGLEHYVHARRA